METSSSPSGEVSLPAVAVPAEGGEGWWSEVRAVLVKDLRSEWRSRSAVGTVLIFALTTMALLSFTVVTQGVGLTQGLRPDLAELIERGGLGGVASIWVTREQPARGVLLATLYWIVLFFAAMAALPRVFVKEEEMRTAPLLRLCARPGAVFAGKLLFNVALLEAVAILLLPIWALFFAPVVASWPLLVVTVLAGAAALAGTATLLGAIVSRADNRAYLMAILGFGPLLPILVFAINGTTDAIQGTPGNNAVALVSYLVVMLVVSSALFERVWAE